MAAVQPPRKRRARQSEAEECEDDAWSLCFADERPYSDSSDDDDDDEEVRRLEAALAAAKAKKKRRRGSGYDTLIADVLTKVIDFLPLDDAAAAKQLSSTTASAARRALTRGRRPFKTFCLDGDGRGCEVIALQSYTDQDSALFREVWALEPGAVMKELTLWPLMPSTGQNCDEIEGALRYLALVEPEATSGFRRIAAAFAGSGELASSERATGILCQWSGRIDGDQVLHAGLEQGNIDLGLGAWETPTDGAKFILRQVLFFGFWSHAEFMGRVDNWLDRRKAEIFEEAYEEIAEELDEIEEREEQYRALALHGVEDY